MEVHIIPMLGDNLCYYITRDLETQPGILIDVAEPEKVVEFLGKLGVQLHPSHVFTTHKHYDHSQGNAQMRELFPGIQVFGGAQEIVPGATYGLNNGQVLDINNMKITCYHTPCHTRGHMLYLFEPSGGVIDEDMEHEVQTFSKGYQRTVNVNRCVFTGDTIFTGGCGRFFEGKPEEMVAAMQLARDVLPANTKMFCGHEYSIANLTFCLTADPQNQVVANWLETFQMKRNNSEWTQPTKLSEEKTFNVFMRCFDADMQNQTGTTDPVACMGFLRQWKNSG